MGKQYCPHSEVRLSNIAMPLRLFWNIRTITGVYIFKFITVREIIRVTSHKCYIWCMPILQFLQILNQTDSDDITNYRPLLAVFDCFVFVNGTYQYGYLYCCICSRQNSPLGDHTNAHQSCQWRWRHNECDGVSNNQPDDCLLNRLFRRRTKKTSKLRVTGLSPCKRAVTRKMFPIDDVIMD